MIFTKFLTKCNQLWRKIREHPKKQTTTNLLNSNQPPRQMKVHPTPSELLPASEVDEGTSTKQTTTLLYFTCLLNYKVVALTARSPGSNSTYNHNSTNP
jgi:hypothetical protein